MFTFALISLFYVLGLIPEILEKSCEECTPAEKANIGKVIRFLVKEKPDWWQKIVKIYDPNGAFEAKYKDYLNKLLKD